MSHTEPSDLAERGRRVLALEADAIRRVSERLGAPFVSAVQLLAAAKGRVIVSGVGKSGLIARKIAATFTSTGTPASFLHPVDSLHGDLGIVGRDDVAILLSKSGTSDDLFGLVNQLKRLGVPIIAMTGDPDSLLARPAEVLLAEKRGTVAVVDRQGSLQGVVTAGDLTRLMEKTDHFLDIPVTEVMTRMPKTTTPTEIAGAAVRVMEQHGIMALPVLDGGRKLVGMVHLHDLMKAGAA